MVASATMMATTMMEYCHAMLASSTQTEWNEREKQQQKKKKETGIFFPCSWNISRMQVCGNIGVCSLASNQNKTVNKVNQPNWNWVLFSLGCSAVRAVDFRKKKKNNLEHPFGTWARVSSVSRFGFCFFCSWAQIIYICIAGAVTNWRSLAL